MEERATPSVQRRRLTAELRLARDKANLTQAAVAEALGWSLSKLNRIEAGDVRVSRTDLHAMLRHYRVSDPKLVDRLVKLAETGKTLEWARFRDVLSPDFLRYLEYESVASSLFSFQPMFVHGLLQTPDYARSIIRALADPHTPSAVLTRQADARLQRQDGMLARRRGRLHFILDEAALRRWVGPVLGSAAIMHRQLEWLVELSRRSNIRIQVVPFSLGLHRGMLGGFTLLRFPDKSDGELLYRENEKRGLMSQDPDVIRRYRGIASELTKSASDAGAIDKVIAEIQATLGPVA